MSVGERIKLARRMRRMSLRDLAATLRISAQMVSNYERDIHLPDSGRLIALAEALTVPIEFFVRPAATVTVSPVYRKRHSFQAKHEQAVLAAIQEWLERYLAVERLHISNATPFCSPAGFPCKVAAPEEVEAAAAALRSAWQLGFDPIENLTELLEDQGLKVGLVSADAKFDACTFRTDGGTPFVVIVLSQAMPGDRQRFSAAHELGHMALAPTAELNEEVAANRFAGAFLVPESVARFELGNHRHDLGIRELLLLKQKYGLSMQAWIYRAKDLGVLSAPAAARLFREFRSRRWHLQEPGPPSPREVPRRMERLVMRALAEDVISEGRAAELLGQTVDQLMADLAQHQGALPDAVCIRQHTLD